MSEPISILVVEDDDLHFDFLGSFSPSQFDVLFADDPDEARAKCEGREISLAVVALERLEPYRTLLLGLQEGETRILGVGQGSGETGAGLTVDRVVEAGDLDRALAAANSLINGEPAAEEDGRVEEEGREGEAGEADEAKGPAASPGPAGARADRPLSPTGSYMARLRAQDARPRKVGAGAPVAVGPTRPSVVSLQQQIEELRRDVGLLASRVQAVDGPPGAGAPAEGEATSSDRPSTADVRRLEALEAAQKNGARRTEQALSELEMQITLLESRTGDAEPGGGQGNDVDVGALVRQLAEERTRREALEQRLAEQGALLESLSRAAAVPAPGPGEPPRASGAPVVGGAVASAGDGRRPKRPTRRGFFGPGTSEIPTVVTRASTDLRQASRQAASPAAVEDVSAEIVGSDEPTIEVPDFPDGDELQVASDAEAEEANTVVEAIMGIANPPPEERVSVPVSAALNEAHTNADAEDYSALTAPGIVPAISSPADSRVGSLSVGSTDSQVMGDVQEMGNALAGRAGPTGAIEVPAMVTAEPTSPGPPRWIFIAIGAVVAIAAAVAGLLLFGGAGADDPEAAGASPPAVAGQGEGSGGQDASAGGDPSADEGPAKKDPAKKDPGAEPGAPADAGASARAEGVAPTPADAAVAPDLSAREIARRKAWARRVQRKALLRTAQRLIGQGKHKQAREELTRAIKIRDDHRARVLLAESHQRSGEHWAAVHHLAKAIGLGGGKGLEERLAGLYLKLGKRAKGCALLKRAAATSPRARKTHAKRCK